MDGRDVPPTSGKGFVEELQAKMAEIGVGRIAAVMGRYYAMDRDNRWEQVEKSLRGHGVSGRCGGSDRPPPWPPHRRRGDG